MTDVEFDARITALEENSGGSIHNGKVILTSQKVDVLRCP